MMDVREKLVELLSEKCMETCKQRKGYVCSVEECRRCKEKCCGFYADHLIANGVTVQEWISVDEKLPQNFISVLGYMTDAGEFPPVRECYTVGNVFFFPALGDIHPVSHWREMPQPPKGE